MTREEALNICKCIHSMKPREGFDNPTKRDIYVNALTDLNYDIAMQALQDCFKTKVYAPEIPEIREAYVAILRKAKREEVSATKPSNCVICQGYGFVIYRRVIDELAYDFLAYCECARGEKWKIVGGMYLAIRYDEALPKEFYTPTKQEVYEQLSVKDVIQNMKNLKKI